jgi:hypothetical protein
MTDNILKNRITKLLNSGLIQKIYPMVKDIKVDSVDEDVLSSYMHLTMLVDDDITYDNMYEKEFDPHYLVQYHVKNLLPYVSVKVDYIGWDVYTTDGKYVAGYDIVGGSVFNARDRYYRPDEGGNKSF